MVEAVGVEDIFSVAVDGIKDRTSDVIIRWTLAQEVADCLFRHFALWADVGVAETHLMELVIKTDVACDELYSSSILFPVFLKVFKIFEDPDVCFPIGCVILDIRHYS